MRLRDSQSWISKTLESAYNTPESTGSNYEFIPTLNPFFALPVVEKVNDAQRIGRNAASHLCNTYWSHFEMSIEDDIETGVPARLFRRALGGAVTDTVVTSGQTWEHEFAMLNPQVGVNLPSFSVPVLLGAASFLFAGCRVDRFRVSQQNNERVRYQADIVGSGKFTTPHGLTSLPALATVPCMDGFRTEVTYVDPAGPTTINLGTAGTLMEWFVELNNGLRRNRRRVGDPVQTVGSGSAAHVRGLPLGQERTTQIGMKLDFVDLTEWTAMTANTTYQDLTITVKGPVIESTNRHEFQIIVPSFAFEVVTPDEDEGDAAISVNVIPFEDSVSKGTITGRIQNATATLV